MGVQGLTTVCAEHIKVLVLSHAFIIFALFSDKFYSSL